MERIFSRREFLKCSAATGVLVAAGGSILDNVMAQVDNGGVTEVDKLTIWILTDNFYDTNRLDYKMAKRFRSGPGKSVHAEHGLSFFIETSVNGKSSALMYDFGLDPVGVINNINLLGLDIGKASAFALSHGHWDHYTAAVTILKQNRPRIVFGTPFYVGEEAFARRYSLRPGATAPADLGQLNKEDLQNLGLKIVEVKTPVELVPGAYCTGNIERVTNYESIAKPQFQIKHGDKFEFDTFPGEQGLFFNVRGKGLVVITGCAHAGIVNTIKHVCKKSGIDKLHAIMGGFHLINQKQEVIDTTVADIKAMRPDYIVPAHCTGFEAMVAFSRGMPDAFILNTAGTQYTFGGNS